MAKHLPRINTPCPHAPDAWDLIRDVCLICRPRNSCTACGHHVLGVDYVDGSPWMYELWGDYNVPKHVGDRISCHFCGADFLIARRVPVADGTPFHQQLILVDSNLTSEAHLKEVERLRALLLTPEVVAWLERQRAAEAAAGYGFLGDMRPVLPED